MAFGGNPLVAVRPLTDRVVELLVPSLFFVEIPSMSFVVLVSDDSECSTCTFAFFLRAFAALIAFVCFAARTGGNSRTSSYSLRTLATRPARSARSLGEGSCSGDISRVDGEAKSDANNSLVLLADSRTSDYTMLAL